MTEHFLKFRVLLSIINEEMQSRKFEKNTYSLNFPSPEYFGFPLSPQNKTAKLSIFFLSF